jgi:2-keto-3-deoxy-6-phosphogluconate aldolase
VACDALETTAERLDGPIWHATGGILSGHNLKHLLAGGVIACIGAWLLHRRRLPIAGAQRA